MKPLLSITKKQNNQQKTPSKILAHGKMNGGKQCILKNTKRKKKPSICFKGILELIQQPERE